MNKKGQQSIQEWLEATRGTDEGITKYSLPNCYMESTTVPGILRNLCEFASSQSKIRLTSLPLLRIADLNEPM
jgi:hypothetical protein